MFQRRQQLSRGLVGVVAVVVCCYCHLLFYADMCSTDVAGSGCEFVRSLPVRAGNMAASAYEMVEASEPMVVAAESALLLLLLIV